MAGKVLEVPTSEAQHSQVALKILPIFIFALTLLSIAAAADPRLGIRFRIVPESVANAAADSVPP